MLLNLNAKFTDLKDLKVKTLTKPACLDHSWKIEGLVVKYSGQSILLTSFHFNYETESETEREREREEISSPNAVSDFNFFSLFDLHDHILLQFSF